MSINVSEQTKGSYTLKQELWCDGETTLNKSDGSDLTHPEEAFKELVKLERKLEVISNRIDSFMTCFAGVDDEVIEFLEELQEVVE